MHLDIHSLWKFKPNIRRKEISVTLYVGMFVGARRADLRMSRTADLLGYWDFHEQPSLGFTKGCPKKKKKSSEQQLSGPHGDQGGVWAG